MKTRINTLSALAAAGVLGLALVGCSGHHHAGPTALNPTAAPTLMVDYTNPAGGVGVLDRTPLMVGYIGSGRHAADIDQLRALRDQAQAEGQADAAAAIEALGAESQEIAHRQLAGDEPLYTILLGVAPELRELMQRHNLSRVVEKGPGVEGVDLTAELVDMLPKRDNAR